MNCEQNVTISPDSNQSCRKCRICLTPSPKEELVNPCNCKDSNQSCRKCRICLTPSPKEELVNPCNCKGSVGDIHIACLETWLNRGSCNLSCELCSYRYNVKFVPMYRFFESMRVWYNQSYNPALLQSNLCFLLIITVLSIITGALFVNAYPADEPNPSNVPPSFRLTFRIYCLVCIAILVYNYIIALIWLLCSPIYRWYNWWLSTQKIKLVLEPKKTLLIKKGSKPKPLAPRDITFQFRETAV